VLEFGSQKRGIKPRAFMRGARDSQRDEALAIVTRKAEERLKIEWAKADAKGGLL